MVGGDRAFGVGEKSVIVIAFDKKHRDDIEKFIKKEAHSERPTLEIKQEGRGIPGRMYAIAKGEAVRHDGNQSC